MFKDIFIWYLVSLALFAVVGGLWASLPEFARVPIVNSIRPIFDWLASLDWAGAGHKIDAAIHWLFTVIVHMLIGLITVIFAMLAIMTIIDLATGLVGVTLQKKEGRGVVVVCLCLSVVAGYYVTTSSYGVSAVSWALSLLDH